MIDNNIKYKNNNNSISNNFEKENEIFYNTILQKFDNKFNHKKLMKMNKNINNNQNLKKEENLKNIKILSQKTGFRPKNTIINNPWKKRPHTSNIRKYNNCEIYMNDMNNEQKERDNNLYEISFYNEGYSELGYFSSNSLPTKTLSNIGNTSYDKINRIIKERKLSVKNLKYGQKNNSNKKISKKNLSFNKKYNSNRTMNNKENNKWNNFYHKNKNKNEVNVYNFDDIIDNFLLKKNKMNKNEDLYALNYYKNIGGKFYSSSNNVNVKKNRNGVRNNVNNKIKNINAEFRYSKD